ncbi:MAG: helix-turn-helix domain-containing protein [Caulobacteraceae bacterium]
MSAVTPDTRVVEPARPLRRRQEDRSAAMRLQLMEATVASLIDVGYARTTTVEICRRAGVTRGALLHHFDSLAALFAATLAHLYEGFLAGAEPRRDEPVNGKALVEGLWRHFSRPEYKAVIELWLASRNEPDLGEVLRPTIVRIRDLADPRLNPRLLNRLGRSDDAVSFYRLVLETMIGMALGRAVTPGDGVMGHEDRVVAMLGRMAAEIFDEPT